MYGGERGASLRESVADRSYERPVEWARPVSGVAGCSAGRPCSKPSLSKTAAKTGLTGERLSPTGAGGVMSPLSGSISTSTHSSKESCSRVGTSTSTQCSVHCSSAQSPVCIVRIHRWVRNALRVMKVHQSRESQAGATHALGTQVCGVYRAASHKCESKCMCTDMFSSCRLCQRRLGSVAPYTISRYCIGKRVMLTMPVVVCGRSVRDSA